jgi:hypothetical protein
MGVMGFLKNLLQQGSPTESNISKALRTVAESNTPIARRDLHIALKRQRLLLPVPKPPDNLQRDASGRLTASARLEFLSFQDSRGRRLVAVFTNPELLKRWKSDAPSWIAIDTPSICRVALESDQSALQINPGDPTFVELSQAEMKSLAEAQATD